MKPQFIVFVRGPEKGPWVQENSRCKGLYKIGFVQGPQKLNAGSRKTVSLGMIDCGFSVHSLHPRRQQLLAKQEPSISYRILLMTFLENGH